MFKKYFALLITVLIINLPLSTSAFANPKETKFAEKMKTNITKLGTGKEARVEVKMRDKTKLKGYISQINENSFLVVDEKTGASTEILYSNAKQVKGNNSKKTLAIVGIIVGIVAVVAIVVAGRKE